MITPGPVTPGIKYALFLIVRQTKVLNICRLRVDCARKCHRSVKASAYPRIFRALDPGGQGSQEYTKHIKKDATEVSVGQKSRRFARTSQRCRDISQQDVHLR